MQSGSFGEYAAILVPLAVRVALANGNVVRLPSLAGRQLPFLDPPKEALDLVLALCFQMLEIGELLDWGHRLAADKFIEGAGPSGDECVPIGNRVDQGENVSVLVETPFVGNLLQDAQFLGVVQ